MKLKSAYFIGALGLAAISVVAGCGSGSSTTPAEDAAFKNHDASAIKPPPAGAAQAPSDFKSSLNNGSSPKPPGQAGPGGN